MAAFRSWLHWEQGSARKALLPAFAAASLLHVHNAYWAAMPVWVLSQPARGILLERALFRIVGTVIGAAVGSLVLAGTEPREATALLIRRLAADLGQASDLLTFELRA